MELFKGQILWIWAGSLLLHENDENVSVPKNLADCNFSPYVGPTVSFNLILLCEFKNVKTLYFFIKKYLKVKTNNLKCFLKYIHNDNLLLLKKNYLQEF